VDVSISGSEASIRALVYSVKRNLRALVSDEKTPGNVNFCAIFHGMAKKPRKSQAAAELGRKRWQGLTAEQRSEIARRAVQARWSKTKRTKKS
jgi:hypothetical protein